MTLILVTPLFLILLYFGAIRLLDARKKEFGQFLVMYLFALLCMLSMGYIISAHGAGEYWRPRPRNFTDQLCLAVIYAPTTFLAAYLLYPFKTVKRNRILMIILLCYAVIMAGGGALLDMGLMLSDM